MNRMKKVLLIAAMACVGIGLAQAQNDNSNNSDNNNNNNGGRRSRFGRNFDPSQIESNIVENARDVLEVKDDGEWKAIEPLIRKVVEAGREAGRDRFNAMRLAFRNRDNGGDNGGGSRRFGGTPSPEMEALDKAVEAKASKSELKAAIAKLQDARKAKQAELEKAQENLRKVLTTRQEAIATANGLL